MRKLREWLIHRLGGYTREEQLCRPIQFVRTEVPIETVTASFIVGQDGIDPEDVLKRKIAEAIITANPSPIKFECSSVTSHGHNVYFATLKICRPME